MENKKMDSLKRRGVKSKSKDPNSFGQRLYQVRISKNMTLDQFSELTGLSLGSLYELENNKRTPNLKTVEKIANAANVSVVYLIYG